MNNEIVIVGEIRGDQIVLKVGDVFHDIAVLSCEIENKVVIVFLWILSSVIQKKSSDKIGILLCVWEEMQKADLI
jgi:hypothetical protein